MKINTDLSQGEIKNPMRVLAINENTSTSFNQEKLFNIENSTGSLLKNQAVEADIGVASAESRVRMGDNAIAK